MSIALIGLPQIEAAKKRIEGVCVRTPLRELSQDALRAAGFDVPSGLPAIYLKCENEQPIGSFKLRGAYNKVASLDTDALRRGVITYSSGNHAQGVSYAARALGSKAVIVMPENSPKIKQEATRALGGEVVIVGNASKDRKQKAEELQDAHGYTMVPPYDDDFVIAGQATCGAEIVEEMPNVEAVFSPVSGGGLLSGIATAVKLLKPNVKVFGVEPALAADATESFRTKRLVEWSAEQTTRTIADGLRTQSLGERNFAHIVKYVDEMVNVSEEEILTAARILLKVGIVAEPSGAVALAGVLFHHAELPQGLKKVAVVVSGGNLDPALRERLLAV